MCEKNSKSRDVGFRGFIVGFDTDTLLRFSKQFDLFSKVELFPQWLAFTCTQKHHSVQTYGGEDRIIKDSSGNNTDASINFIPKMNPKDLLDGYNGLIRNIYSIKPYYKKGPSVFANLSATLCH